MREREFGIPRRFLSLPHPIVAHHLRHAKSIVAKHATSSRALRRAMRFDIAPARNRLFIAPERQRQHALRIVQTLKPLDRDEALDLI